MKKLALFALAMLMLAACGTKSIKENEKPMDTLTFNAEQAAFMSAIACNEAKADYIALADAINGGLDAGLTVSQVKEALSHLYAYTGFPRSLNALGTLQKVLEQHKNEGKTTIQGVDASPLPKDFDALKVGTEVQTKVSGRAFDYAFCPAEDYYLKAHLFGDIFARDNLTYADRELITVSALSGLENVMPQLQAHVRGALNMGVTEEQLRNIPVALKANGLTSEALRCESAIAAAVDGKTDVVCSQSEWPIGEPNTMFEKYFIGNSYLAVLDPSVGLCNVTFEPGCRNNWHIHHGAVQVLMCVSGRGWYQEWGKEPVELKPGVVIAIPEGVKHWHGAATDSWMQHLTYHADAKPGNSTEWLEEVDDTQYNSVIR
ncbi:MAG: carboxymuconolactone decarboxylase family protein [Bacteroidales bacterium]|nr:carboxymuconolactone decarboxylase family protein [Bacteroidales bacterium]